VHALPVAYAGADAPPETTVVLTIPGAAGGDWTVWRGDEGWQLLAGADNAPACRVTLPAGAAWRLFTRGLAPEEARAQAQIDGDGRLAAPLFGAVAILA
jgi:hypothetical protein